MPVREGGDEGEALLDQQAETKQHQKVNSRQNQTVSTQQFLRPDDAGVKVAPVATFKKRGGAGQCRNFRRRGRPGFEGNAQDDPDRTSQNEFFLPPSDLKFDMFCYAEAHAMILLVHRGAFWAL